MDSGVLVKSLSVGEVRVAPGEKDHGFFAVAEHPDGSLESLPYIVANGTEEGPALWITGCEHGEESLAAAAIIEF
ncbi:MAG: hypothetical protein WCA77_02330, partial [Thermoplasmata archaeon]